MPIYRMICQTCGVQKDEMMKYDVMIAGVACECGEEMRNQICPSRIKGTSSDKYIMAPDVGPLSKSSKAYEKKKDDEASTYYAPSATFGSGGLTGFKERKVKQTQIDTGKTDFTKDK